MRRITLLFLLSFAFLCVFPQFVFAADAATETKSQVNITVVMPDVSPTPTPKPTPAPTPVAPVIPLLYPSSIEETEVNGSRQIIKVYELGAGENPKDIPRDSFKRDGWEYDLSDITKSETSDTDKQDHTETVKVDTSTNDTAAILQQLAPTLDYKSDDGYSGILTLDITTIKVETAGTRTSSYTVSATREFPNLSNEDTSLVPKTITDSGRTMKLAGIQWRAQSVDGIDGEQIPSTYTAVAQYTGTGSKTVITGYVTTADYKGFISKTSAGKTVYRAIFIGTEIKPEPVAFVSTDPTDSMTVSPTPGDKPCTGAPTSTAEPSASQDASTAAVTPKETVEVTPTAEATQGTTTEPATVTAAAPSQTPGTTIRQTQNNEKREGIWPSVLSIRFVLILLNGAVYYLILRKKPAVKPEAPETKDEKPSEDDDDK